tara:strand:- start:1399 stop:3468 length:2070 start_codon:yes stop_codon:yes gene_type:complete
MANGGDDNTGGPPGGDAELAILERKAQLLEEIRKEEEKDLVRKAARIERERQALELEVENLKHSKERIRLAHQRTELRVKTIEWEEIGLALDRERAATLAASDKAEDQATARRLRAKFAEREALLEANKDSSESLLNTQTQTKNLAKLLTGVGDQWKQTFAGGFITAAAGGVDDLKDKMAIFKGSLVDAINPANILGSALMRVAQTTLALAKEQDAAIAAFNKSTSSMGEYNKQIISVERNNVGLGISTQASAKAFGSLLTGVTDFAHANAPVPAQLANTAAQMEKLGVSTDLTAKTMESAMRVMGMSAEESMDLNNELAAMAIQMRLPIEQVTEGFNAAMPSLAKFGRDAVDVFKKVQVASRSLGVAVGDLLTTMGQFDTFRGAAEAAGKLNAILGGDLLNSTELLMATEDERLRMVRESLDMSGRTFDSMNRFEKQAIASALGIGDISTATKMLTGDMNKFGTAAEENPLTKKEIEERIKKAQAVSEKFAETWRLFAVSMYPIVEGFGAILDLVFKANDYMKGTLIPTILLVGGAIAMATGGLTALLGGAAVIAGGAGMWSALGGEEGAGAAAGEIQGFADGVDSFDGGANEIVKVGEKGPELIVLPPKSSVINNKNFTQAIAQSKQLTSGQSQQQAVTQPQPAAAPQKPTETTVVIKIGNQEMGRAVIKAIESVPGFNLRGLPRGV